jgi:3-methyladenine DNA glycosylase AlkC
MAELLKNMFNTQFLTEVVKNLQKVYPSFAGDAFLQSIFDADWESRELKQRIRHISLSLRPLLPPDYASAVQVLIDLANYVRETEQRDFVFEYIFLPDFVEVFGLNDFEISVQAIEQITQLMSAEFAVRPFIEKYPEKMLAQMLIWSQHSHPLVRRLSSEGARPRLPWGIALKNLKKDPSPILPILENLKADSSETVRKSVANNLNDIAKDNPEIVLKIMAQWQGKNPQTDWIIKHGSRTLLKKANNTALNHFGFESIKSLIINNLTIQKTKIKIGEVLEFAFDLQHQENQAVKIRLEYGIDYVKAKGGTSRKIFQISETEFTPNQTYNLARKQRFQDFTTRKHYAGMHKLAIIANGQVMAEISFELSE